MLSFVNYLLYCLSVICYIFGVSYFTCRRFPQQRSNLVSRFWVKRKQKLGQRWRKISELPVVTCS